MRSFMNQAFPASAVFLLVFLQIISPLWAQEIEVENIHQQSALINGEEKNWQEARLHAQQSADAILQAFIEWLALQDVDSGASFEEIAAFIRLHPDWPEQKKLRLRAEQALVLSPPDDATLKQWFEQNPPVTGAGKIMLAELGLRANHDIGAVLPLIRDAWRDGDFSPDEENRIRATHGTYLRAQDHAARADQLLWEGKLAAAERMLPSLGSEQQALVRARIALQKNEKLASLKVLHLSQKLQATPGVMYDRMMWRLKRDDNKGVRDILLSAPGVVPYPQKWWRVRERQIREAVDEQNFSLAKKLLRNHGQEEGSEYADAAWLSGWIALEYAGQPQEAYKQFYAMFNAVSTPVSKARAAYWAARAAAKAGDQSAAQSWFASAASYPSVFYGQLASAEIYGAAPLKIPADPIAPREKLEEFNRNPLVRVIKMCIENGHEEWAAQFANHLIEQESSAHSRALVALMVSRMQSTLLGVRAAKRALQNGTLLLETAFPVPKLSPQLAVEPALAYAIARQESEFDPKARSRANAQGYMQLLPSTAREVARKNDIPFQAERLYEPAYNTQLGSLYLDNLIALYDGSYVKAIAAYNAGPGNIRKWVTVIGNPGKNLHEVINWIEKIPFSETRNYVQRVMENLQVYRYLLSQQVSPQLRIEEDLKR